MGLMAADVKRFCSACGARMRTVDDDGLSRWSCPDCGTIDYENPKPCVTALVVRSSRLLLLRRALDPGAGLWDFPGGFLEKGETPEAGLRREILEELGTEVKSARFFGFFPDNYGESKIPILNIVYVCELKGGIAGRGEEFTETGWFGADSFPDGLAFRSMRAILEAWRVQEAA